LIALDVHYGEVVRGAAVAFADPAGAEKADFEIVETFDGTAEPYVPGEFKKRELPFLLKLLGSAKEHATDVVLVDGYVQLGEDRPGLGAHLHAALEGRCAVIGVAKTKFNGATSIRIVRGASTSPLFITAIGMEPKAAAELVRTMHGPHRIPTLLRRVDQLSRGL